MTGQSTDEITKSHTEDRSENRAFAKGSEWKYDHHAAGEDAGRSQAGNGTSDNEGGRVGARSAEGRPDLEDHNRNKENPFFE